MAIEAPRGDQSGLRRPLPPLDEGCLRIGSHSARGRSSMSIVFVSGSWHNELRSIRYYYDSVHVLEWTVAEVQLG